MFRIIILAGGSLPKFDELEVRLIGERTTLRMETNQKEESKMFIVQRNPSDHMPIQIGQYHQTQVLHIIHRESLNHQCTNLHITGGHILASARHKGSDPRAYRTTSFASHTPRYKTCAPDKPRAEITCNLCGIEGHIERKCNVKGMIDKMEYCEAQVLECKRETIDYVHAILKPPHIRTNTTK